jgi:protein-tyrosine phosphatase
MFRKLVQDAGLDDQIETDSAGTHAYHVGKGPDRRALEAAAGRNLHFDDLRARQTTENDFIEFDYVLAMDMDNFHNLSEICPLGYESRLSMFMDYAQTIRMREVPDPYYGGADGFEKVLDMVEDASQGLLDAIREEHGL